jgi:stage V sporulation protein AA
LGWYFGYGRDMHMKGNELYIKIEQESEVFDKKVILKDIAKLYCANTNILNHLNQMVIFSINENTNKKYTISILMIIESINKKYPELSIVNLGEADFIVFYKVSKKPKKAFEYLKVTIVGLTVFFGSAFSIMTFNTDVSVGDIFNITYELIMGEGRTEGSILEISYSIGLPVGIMIFFNHFSKRKTNNDPTPMQIQMRTYEKDINNAIIQDAEREGKSIDVH